MPSNRPAAGLRTAAHPGQPHPPFTTSNKAYAQDLYMDLIEESRIHEFLGESDAYNCADKQWAHLSPSTDWGDLLKSMHRTVSSIVRWFVKPEGCGVRREAVLAPDALLRSDMESKQQSRLVPQITVEACGPSFGTTAVSPSTQSPTCHVYLGMASYMLVKPDCWLESGEKIVEEMEPNARRIFRHQPNRSYVRSLLLTERHVVLVHFDRAGCQISPPINLHENPATFIRLVAGVSCANERLLGLDESVRSTEIGDKLSGTITIRRADGVQKVYEILERISTMQWGIEGRATTCWRVRDPVTSEELVVKDTWRPTDFPPEYEHLELMKGIPGVAQISW
ncbi:hypothetical protein NMY22_g1428 [Coprinellus aureogranulatus]|nr:hypothetical protein NMY22_g1428 [Coprinellus aureogranulatus]